MRVLCLILLMLVISACSSPPVKDELFHMRKSSSIEAILENMDELNYDESYSEIDRDKFKLSYASQFHKEVSTLFVMLKNNATTLPNKEPIPQEKQHEYQRIIKLLDANLDYLKKVIERKEDTLIMAAVKSTQKSCTQCHLTFKSGL